MAGGLLLRLLVQLAICARSRGYPAGHPCADPALALKPFCDESLTTAQRAAAMAESLSAMEAELSREDMPITPPGLTQAAAKNIASNGDEAVVDTASWQAHAPQPTPTDPGLERLELTAGFGLGCVSACCAVMLTALRAAWRDGVLGQREVLQANLAAANGNSVSRDIDDASTSDLAAALDEIIAASGGGSGARDGGNANSDSLPSVDGQTLGTGNDRKVKRGTRSMKNEQPKTARLHEVRSLQESIVRSEELSS